MSSCSSYFFKVCFENVLQLNYQFMLHNYTFSYLCPARKCSGDFFTRVDLLKHGCPVSSEFGTFPKKGSGVESFGIGICLPTRC